MRPVNFCPVLLLLASLMTLPRVCTVRCKRASLGKQKDVVLDKDAYTGERSLRCNGPRTKATLSGKSAPATEGLQEATASQEGASDNESSVDSVVVEDSLSSCEDCRSMCELLAVAKDAGVTKTSCEELFQHMDGIYSVKVDAETRLSEIATRDTEYYKDFVKGQNVEFVGIHGSHVNFNGLRGKLSRWKGGRRGSPGKRSKWYIEVTDIIDELGARTTTTWIRPKNLMLLSKEPEATKAEDKLREDLDRAVTACSFPFNAEDLWKRSLTLSSCGQVHTDMKRAWVAVSESIQEAISVLGGRLFLEKLDGIRYITFEKLFHLPMRLRELSARDKQLIDEYCELVNKTTDYKAKVLLRFGQGSEFQWDPNILHVPLEVCLSGAHSLLNKLDELMGEPVCLV